MLDTAAAQAPVPGARSPSELGGLGDTASCDKSGAFDDRGLESAGQVTAW
jgi:hypothetical protein